MRNELFRFMCVIVQSALREGINIYLAHLHLIKDRIIKMIKRIFVPILAALFLAGVFGSISGCNTMEGAGKDVEQGGKAIKDEANEHK